ncbi:MAG TPA: hypothetical protein EYG66_00135, partial [Mariprofundaceae bacterium]|nr:hypothetical protein [Mariprofundaceae bacterium]
MKKCTKQDLTLIFLETASQSGALQAGSDRTNIFITPSYEFKMIDALLTN